ncbi:PAS domain-containing protein [Deltaproteobacteria bacterium TL4]
MRTAVLEIEFSAEEHGRTFFISPHDAVLLLDDEKNIVDANPEAFTLLGVSREYLLELKLENFIFKENKQEVQETWEALLEEGHQIGKIQVRKPNGLGFAAQFHALANIRQGLHLWIFQPLQNDVYEPEELPCLAEVVL